MDTTEEKIHAIIAEHLPAKDKEKGEFGEVFTPPSMISNMYDYFPKDKLKSTTTWLDPASGIGNFGIVLFFHLMKELRSTISSEHKRAKHIIEKMIFMVEINKNNVATCSKIFKKLCPDAIPNLYEGNFLTLDTGAIGWPSSFDCIVGNPPYNIGGTGLEGSKRTHIVFTEKAIERLSSRGIVAYICPPSYREAGTPMNKLFQNARGHFIYIKIYGAKETFDLFHIQGRVDTFLFQKGAKGKTIVDDEYHVLTKNISIDLNRHIPNFGFTIFEKLYKRVDELGAIKAFRNTEMSSIKSNTFGCHGRNKVLHLILSKGKRVFKTKQKHSLADTPKILINGLGVPYVYDDRAGEYGPSQTPVIIVKPTANLVNLLQSDFFSFLAWGLRLTGNNNLPYLFDALPDIRKEKNSFKTMEDIATGFHLTTKEVTWIQDHFHEYKYIDKDLYEPCTNKTRKKK
jgi:hypothetical protein